MLDLKPRVHFEEVEAAVGAGDELDGARRKIADRRSERDCLPAHRLAHLRRDERGGRFLDDLLVPPLHRAFALAEVQDSAVLVAKHLDLDMARALDEFLDQDAVVAEARQPLAANAVKLLAHVLLGKGEPHPLAAAAGRRLHHHRIADPAGNLDGMVGVPDLTDEAGDDADSGGLRQLLRFDLVAHRRDRLGRRADKRDACLGKRPREALALGQEAIARMHRFGAGGAAGVDDQLGLEIGFSRRRRPQPHALVSHHHVRRASVGIRIDRHRGDPHLPRRLDDAAGNFAPVRNQDLLEHLVGYSLGPLSCLVRSRVSWARQPS